jgi:hypothetical protein
MMFYDVFLDYLHGKTSSSHKITAERVFVVLLRRAGLSERTE